MDGCWGQRVWAETLVKLYKNATTIPVIRAAIQKSTVSDHEVGWQLNVSHETVCKWRKRDTVQDGGHTAHRLKTTLNGAREELVIYLRTQLLLRLDDL
ncbi:hypothetical protein [Ideonella livida]|uniref:Uncharacterized protein n=1 Tax=Ideonella livida TaxID=2707176 RepID=A0A7C9TLL1_9BURK|nr:hypothetical protein [Ideonella livida]NDY93620.1 hypothetical protein [Ideonella livida]